MTSRFKDRLASAAFAPPNCDGSLRARFRGLSEGTGPTRPTRGAGLRAQGGGHLSAFGCVGAVRGALVRTVHAQGGRDASFYLPTFLLYYAGGFPARPLVTHVHMQALPANRHFIDALGLKPVIMIRAIPDMLASYADMLEPDPHSPDNWLNIRVPPHYLELDARGEGRFPGRHDGPLVCQLFRHLDGICRRGAGARAGAGL